MAGINDVFKALADPTRREIIAMLRAGPRTSGEIAERFPTAWATVSRHLAVLREAEIVVPHRNGTSISYELNATVIQELIGNLLDWSDYGKDES